MVYHHQDEDIKIKKRRSVMKSMEIEAHRDVGIENC
jgi:hypothetical protein